MNIVLSDGVEDSARCEKNCKFGLSDSPSRRLSWAKIVQGESRTSSLLERYAEPSPILCKDTIIFFDGQCFLLFSSSWVGLIHLFYVLRGVVIFTVCARKYFP